MRRYITFAIVRWKLCAGTTFEISPLSNCTLCLQKSYISKGIQSIFDIFASARRCWGRAFGWKVSGAQPFYFCNGKLKSLRIDNIWNFATFILYTVPEKILYLQRYSTDFRKLCRSKKNLRVDIRVESFKRADILLLQWQGENFAHVQHLKFPTFNVYTVTAKILYLQRYSTDLRNLCLSSKMWRVGNLVENFRRAAILRLQWQAEIVAYRQHLKFCHFQSVHCRCKNPISPKVFIRFSKSLPQLEYFEGGHLGGKFQARRYIAFAMESENFAHRQHLKFCHFQPVHCARKNPISPKVFNRFSKCLSQLEDFEGGHLGRTFQARSYFTFATGRWKHCASQYLKFCHFQLYTVAAKLLIFQCYSNDFPNLRLSWTMLRVGIWVESFRREGSKMLREGIWVESFRRAAILLLQWQVEIVAYRQHLKFCHFHPVHCAWKNPISPKVFNRFSKTLPQQEEFEGGHSGGKFQARRYFTFAMARWKLCACTTFEISHFQCVHCHSKNPISPKVFNRFTKSLPQLEDVEGGQFGGKFQARSYFTFAMASWNRCVSTTFEILPLSICTLSLQKSYIAKGIHPIFEIFATARIFWGWASGWKVSSAQVYCFCNGKWKLCASTTFEILPLSTCTLCQKKSYISKGIQPIFEMFVSARRCWGWAFGWKDSRAQLFYFYNGQVKTLRMYNIWNFPLSISTLSRQKSYIPKGIQPIFEIFASARRCLGRAFGWKVSGAQVFYFCNGKVKTLRIYNIWNFPLSTCTLCLQKSYISKGIQPIFEIFASARRCWGWAFGRKDWGAQLFYFCNGKWKLCASTTFEILPLSTGTLCLQKSYISKGIPPIFEIFASARRLSGRAFGWKVWSAQVFYFCNGKVKTLRLDNIWNFATFNLYTMSAKILYLQRYSTDFRNLCLSSKTMRVGIRKESFRRASILLLKWQGENFAHVQHLKFCEFQPVHCASKNSISPQVFNRFSKCLAQLEDFEGGHLGRTFQARRYFTFAMARWKPLRMYNIWNFPLSICTLSQ